MVIEVLVAKCGAGCYCPRHNTPMQVVVVTGAETAIDPMEELLIIVDFHGVRFCSNSLN